MNKLLAYDWPGNIRELQNVVERAVILARGEVLRAEFLPLVSGARAVPSLAPAVLTPSERPAPPRSPAAPVVPFSDAERAAILRALDMTAWRISGDGGAAQLAFEEAIDAATSPERKAALERALLVYCALDTWAMVVLRARLCGRDVPPKAALAA